MCNEYENSYEGEYESTYDQSFVFYDDEDYEEGLEEMDDLILEEVPFVYCPSKDEFAEA